MREAAQVVDAGQAGAGDVQAARLGPGDQEQLVVPDEGAVVTEADRLGRAVDQVHGLAGRCSSTSFCAYQAGSCTKTLSRSSLPSR